MKEVNNIYEVLDADKCYREKKKGRRIEDVEDEGCNFKYGSQEMFHWEGDV